MYSSPISILNFFLSFHLLEKGGTFHLDTNSNTCWDDNFGGKVDMKCTKYDNWDMYLNFIDLTWVYYFLYTKWLKVFHFDDNNE